MCGLSCVCACVCGSVYVCVCVCVCMYVRKRLRESARLTISCCSEVAAPRLQTTARIEITLQKVTETPERQIEIHCRVAKATPLNNFAAAVLAQT
jgi:hypothetical protein